MSTWFGEGDPRVTKLETALREAKAFIAEELENREAACFDGDPVEYLERPRELLAKIGKALGES